MANMSLDEVMKKINKDFKEELVTVGLPEYDYVRVPFTSPRMNYMTFGGLALGKLVEFYGEEHGGKALGLDCGILTPTGYVKMRDITVGTKVIDGTGKVTTVSGVYPQGVKPMYRITFADHSSIDCSDEHLWEVQYHSSHGIKSKVMSTLELLQDYKTTKSGRNYFKYSIPTPIISDIDTNSDLPIDPYLLGVLIGDGSLSNTSRGIRVTISEPDIFSRVSMLLSNWNMELRNIIGTYDYRICHIDSIPNQYSSNKTLRSTLDDLGLLGKSVDKHIPKEYLYTSVENRLRLLQGLYDIDGYTYKNGRASYTTSSKQLSDDFSFLVRSLGGIDMITSDLGTYKKDGELIECNTCYTHTIVFKNGIVPCSSHKHLSRYVSDRLGSYYRKIVSIDKIEDCECQCIKVESTCHTFIVDNVTITHNTTTALDIIANYQNMDIAKRVVYMDCENTLDVVWAKKLGVDTDTMIIVKPTNQSAEQIFQMILDFINTGEVGLVVIDSLGVMVSQQALDKDMTEKTYAGISGALTTFCEKVVGPVGKHQALVIGINQIRANMNSMFGGTTTPGGHAWKHACSVRMEFRRGKFLDAKGKEVPRNTETPYGNVVEVSMPKNKTCPPTRHLGRYTLTYADGIDYFSDLLELALLYDIVEQSGSWFKVIDISSGEILADKLQGATALKSYLSDHPEILKIVEDLVNEKLESTGLLD